MGSTYDFNLLMYFLALCIGTRCLPGYHGSYNTSQTVYARSNLSPPPCLPSLCPFVSPQSPLLALCVSLLLPAAAAWLSFLFCSTMLHRWKLLSFTVLKRMRKHVATKEFVRRQSPKMWFRTSFAPRSDLVKIAASQNPAWRGFGKALPWSAAWSAAAAVVACAAASGQGTVFGRRTKRFVKGWKLCGRNQKHKKITWKKSIRSAVCHGEVDERIDWHEAEFIIETTGMWRFVGWKCHETWCAMRRMIADNSDCSSRHMAANFWLSTVH